MSLEMSMVIIRPHCDNILLVVMSIYGKLYIDTCHIKKTKQLTMRLLSKEALPTLQ